MKNETHYITAQGKVRLEKDLLELETVKMSRLIDLMPNAAEGSDSAENSEMQNLQHDLDLMAVRIETLRNTLANVTIINPDVLTKTIQIGSTVLVQEGNEEPESYMIVGSAEADPAAGMISNVSPLGKTLLGKSAGETVSVQVGLEDPTLFLIIKIQPTQGGEHYATI